MPPTADENKATIRAHIEDAINAGDAARTAQGYAADTINHADPRNPRAGRAGVERAWRSLYTAFPDWQFVIEDIAADGDMVWCRVTLRGTHLGTPELPVLGGLLVGVPPTGRRIEVQHVHIFRLRDGEITEHAAVRDDLRMGRQLGLIPAPVPATV